MEKLILQQPTGTNWQRGDARTSLGRADPEGGAVVGFYLIYSSGPSDGLMTSRDMGVGDGLFDINSQVSFLLKLCTKESKFIKSNVNV